MFHSLNVTSQSGIVWSHLRSSTEVRILVFPSLSFSHHVPPLGRCWGLDHTDEVHWRNSWVSSFFECLWFTLSYIQEDNLELSLKAGTERKDLGVKSSERYEDRTATEVM